VTDTLDAGTRSSSTSADPDTEHELVMFLEPDQLTSDTAIPVTRARLTKRLNITLWLLRVFVIVVSAMVIYTFATSLH
jgi:hypothetical protein